MESSKGEKQGFKAVYRQVWDDSPFGTFKRMCEELHQLGIEAHLIEDSKKVNIKNRDIDISGSPIHWIRILIPLLGDDPSPSIFEYGVPDSRHFLPVDLKSIFVKKIPVFGKTIDVRWQGDDRGTGIARLLSQDEYIRNSIMALGELKIEGHPERGYWLIIEKRYSLNSPLVTSARWRFYEKIAELLIGTKLPV